MADSEALPSLPPSGADIALLTDFGSADWYVASMKAAIRPISPHSMLIDLTHAIAPGDIAEAAFVLAQAHGDFCDGTVFCVVVDPGVGSQRRALVATDGRQFFVGPDNGVLSAVAAVCRSWRCHAAVAPEYQRENPSPTFHGRDVFAPAAAWLARGAPLEDFGPPAPDMLVLPAGAPQRLDDGRWLGHVVYVDRFGNAFTSFQRSLAPFNIPAFFAEAVIIRWEGMACHGIGRTFSDVPRGKPLAYWGSSGHLEVGINQGQAAKECGLVPGAAVYVCPIAGAEVNGRDVSPGEG